jgi:DNA-directed RNA polymerase specialized sigma subunit
MAPQKEQIEPINPEDHLKLVAFCLKKIKRKRSVNVDDTELMLVGMEALVKAASNFDPERGCRFATYAVLVIRGAMLDCMKKECSLEQRKLKADIDDYIGQHTIRHARSHQKAKSKIRKIAG